MVGYVLYDDFNWCSPAAVYCCWQPLTVVGRVGGTRTVDDKWHPARYGVVVGVGRQSLCYYDGGDKLGLTR